MNISYLVGDKVVLTKEKPVDNNWTPEMDKFLGQVVTITSLESTRTWFTIEEDGETNGFYLTYITGLADAKEEKARTDAEKAKEEKKAKDLAGLLYRPEQILPLVEGVFGKDRVELVYNTSNYDIIIHYPEINLENSLGQKHTIKDFFFKITVDTNLLDTTVYKIGVSIHGMRTTFGLKEITCSYSHSHLHTGSPGTWKHFCVGSDHFPVLMENLRMNPTEDNWTMFLLSIDKYLQWESREGGPYAYMENLKYGRTIGNEEIQQEFARIIEDSPLDMWNYANEIEVLPERPSFKEFFNKNSRIKTAVGGSLEDIKIDIKSQRTRLPANYFAFKGKLYPFRIFDDVSNGKEEYISKGILDTYTSLIKQNTQSFGKKLIYEQLKNEYKSKVRKIRIKLPAKASDNREATEADRVPASENRTAGMVRRTNNTRRR